MGKLLGQFGGRFSLPKGSGAFAFLLLLFVNVVEVLPELHHHEDEHACVQLDGGFYYLDALDSVESTRDDVPRLRGFRIGENHDHHKCSLCHSLTLGLTNDHQINLFPHVDSDVFFWGSQGHLSRATLGHHNRGPPVIA